MGGQNVKNTMVERLLDLAAPHLCLGCGKEGRLVCDNCKYDISFDPFVGCILCGRPQRRGVCDDHAAPFVSAYVASSRSGVVKALLDNLKFHNAKAAAKCLAEILDQRAPYFPSDAIIVPIPTSSAHRRERGYDQTDLIARHFAHLRNLRIEYMLRRTDNAVQHMVGRRQRADQACHAYALGFGKHVTPGRYYIILDDIITTGATVTEASRLITEAGGIVAVVAGAYQALGGDEV